ncbi:acrylate utilization transcriptional regulator AcuR [Dactylosporangium sp. CA-092794]|uniref:acrylate utilization transcriptional regulator AcuR n=1 Tax=Dactylosporangium sp. CA-092794 TaxID=3239929 RepID=UPI003D8DC20C
MSSAVLPAVPPARRGRPPKIAREHGDTREALLRCGMEVLTAQGMSATGIDTVLKRVGVPKGSFYHYFDSKDAFGLEVLQRYADYFARKLDRWLLEEDQAPLQRLVRFVEDAKAGMARFDFERGCLVGNLGQEILALPDTFRTALEDVLRDWERRLAACLRLAVEAGELPADSDCDELASFFWIGWEGAVLRARLARDVRPLDVFITGFLAGVRLRSKGM